MNNRYGVRFASQLELFKNKQRKAWRKYKGYHPFSDTDVRDKIKRTILERYGVEYPILNNDIKAKIINTNINRYGVENAATNDLVKEKIKLSNSSQEVKHKTITTNQEKYGVDYFNQIKLQPVLTYLTNKEWMQHQINILGIVGIAQLLQVSIDTVRKYKNSHNIECSRKSNFELLVYQFIKNNYNGEIITNKRFDKIKEIDIFLPDIKLAIECNGTYWHSELNGRNNRYHLTKTTECNKLGIHLIHIWEHEWNQQFDIVTSRLLNLLEKSTVIFARKCKIQKVNTVDQKRFLNDNHIQGYSTASIGYGLYYDSDLVAIMTFCKGCQNAKYDYELVRYATKKQITVIGGGSRLLKYFKTHIQFLSMVSYSDKSWNSGKFYRMLGFTLSYSSKPSYKYTKDYKIMFNRIKFQKHKLNLLLGIFDSVLSEWENMQLNGYDRIWDCGTDVWVL